MFVNWSQRLVLIFFVYLSRVVMLISASPPTGDHNYVVCSLFRTWGGENVA